MKKIKYQNWRQLQRLGILSEEHFMSAYDEIFNLIEQMNDVKKFDAVLNKIHMLHEDLDPLERICTFIFFTFILNLSFNTSQIEKILEDITYFQIQFFVQ